MSSLQCLRGLIKERLTAAAEEIFTHVENIIVEYEAEVNRQRKLLEIVGQPQVRLQRIEQHIYNEEEEEEEEVLAEQQLWNQEWNSSLDQEEPESLQIKEEEEEICSSQEQEQLELKQEADTFMLTPDNEESDHMEPEPDTDHQLLSAVAESQDQTGNMRNVAGEKPHMCNFYKKCFARSDTLTEHVRTHTSEEPYSCGTCGKRFQHRSTLIQHKIIHTDSHQIFSEAQSVLNFVGQQCIFCTLNVEATSGHLLHKHLSEAVYFLDGGTEKFVVACYCREAKETHRSHNHCPLCNYRVFSRTTMFKKHLHNCHGLVSYKKKGRQSGHTTHTHIVGQ